MTRYSTPSVEHAGYSRPKHEPLNEAERAIVIHVGFEAGIVPMEKVSLDMRRALKSLSPEEARKLKRKFRKLWRKAAKALGRGAMGKGKQTSSKHEKLVRKRAVYDMLWTEQVAPILERFNDPSSDVHQIPSDVGSPCLGVDPAGGSSGLK